MPEPSEAEMQEKLKNMSPEEIAELQKQQCIFCKIIKGEIPAKTVYEDDICKVILDIYPAAEGHVIIVPKEHVMFLPQLDDSKTAHLFMVAKAFCHAILRVMGATGSNIYVANGGAAGQRAPHFLVHVIPRKENDGVPIELSKAQVPANVMVAVEDRLATLLGFRKPVEQKPTESRQPDSKQQDTKLQQPDQKQSSQSEPKQPDLAIGKSGATPLKSQALDSILDNPALKNPIKEKEDNGPEDDEKKDDGRSKDNRKRSLKKNVGADDSDSDDYEEEDDSSDDNEEEDDSSDDNEEEDDDSDDDENDSDSDKSDSGDNKDKSSDNVDDDSEESDDGSDDVKNKGGRKSSLDDITSFLTKR